MREIKFRAWSNDVNDMFFKGDHYGTTHDTDCITYARSQNVVLMQYTGLKDKNGVEIYEGDIVESKSGVPAKDAITWGVFGHAEFGVTSPFINIYEPSSIEVIGNIYESPELLEA